MNKPINYLTIFVFVIFAGIWCLCILAVKPQNVLFALTFALVIVVSIFAVVANDLEKKGKWVSPNRSLLQLMKRNAYEKVITPIERWVQGPMCDTVIYNKLGCQVYIRNGMGYGFISSPEIYNNGYLEIGFGRVTSGYGDWGGGFSHTSDTPLKVVIDKYYNIINTSTHSFHNSEDSQLVEKKAIVLQKQLNGSLMVENHIVRDCINQIFAAMPFEEHIGLEIDINDEPEARRMLAYFLKTKEVAKDLLENQLPY